MNAKPLTPLIYPVRLREKKETKKKTELALQLTSKHFWLVRTLECLWYAWINEMVGTYSLKINFILENREK